MNEPESGFRGDHIGHDGQSASRPIEIPSWPFIVLGVLVVARAAIFSVALIIEPWEVSPARVIPAWVQVLQFALFSALALALLHYGRSDRRAWALGVFILDAGATFLEPLVRSIDSPSPSTWLSLHLRTDAFQAALLWFFASVFPKPAEHRALGVTMAIGTAGGVVLGVALAAMETYAQVVGPGEGPLASLAHALQRFPAGDQHWYFTLQFLWLVPLLVVVPLNLREAGPNDLRRFVWLALGITVGLFPLVANLFLQTFSPAYVALVTEPRYNQIRFIAVFVGFTVIPVAAAYAALVQRTLDVRLVIRAAMQYLLARSFILFISLMPFMLLFVMVALNRNRSVAELLTGGQGLVLHFRFTNRPKFAQSLERRPGETLWWTKGWLPTLRTPYFPFARTPVGNKLVYQRLFDDFEFELGV